MQRPAALWLLGFIFAGATCSALQASGYHPEKVRGPGLGVDFTSKGANPIPAVGYFWGEFGYLSLHARASVAYRPANASVLIRGGFGMGFALLLLNFDVTYQTGEHKSAGMYWGLSSFLSGEKLTPEIFAGYQTNFAAGVESFVLAGARVYLNLAEWEKR